MRLRDYQEAAVEAVLNEWGEGRNKTLLILPTGCGKTIAFSSVIQRRAYRGKSLILAHREELLDQAADKLYKTTGIVPAFEQADRHALDSNAPVVIGSIQTLTNDYRLNSFDPRTFSTIVVDEAHHCLSQSYQKVLNYFKHAQVLGVTATPDRADKKNLASYFDSIAYEYPLKEAVHRGYLTPLKALMIPLELDLKNARVQHGDYVASDVGNALEPYLEQIAEEMAKRCMNRRTVIFLPLVKISQHFCDLLNRKGFRAAEVNGESKNRKEILADFESGKYNAICNSMLLTEGWDCPSVDCIVMLRPTKSRALYVQCVGRGLRLSPQTNKKDLLILDFLWLTETHSLCRPSCLVGADEAYIQKIDNQVATSGDVVDILEAGKDAERDVLEERKQKLAEELALQRQKQLKLVDPLQYAFSIESQILTDYQPVYKWECDPITDNQRARIEKMGIASEGIKTKGEAKVLIETLINRANQHLATPKQIRCLERRGFVNVGTWSFQEANDMITAIANNRWRVPRNIDIKNYRKVG